MKKAIKRSLDRSLDRLGYQLLRSRAPASNIDASGRFVLAPIRRTMQQALDHLKHLGFQPSVIIDAGAGSGTEELLRSFPDVFTFWVEPMEEFEPALQELRARHPGKVVIAAAGPRDGEIVLYAHENAYGSSVLHESDGRIADGTERKVRMVRLDTLLTGMDLGGQALLKVDVQGFEIQVLEGAVRTLPQCEVVILEASFFKLHESAPEFFELLAYMNDRGFVAYDIVDGHNRPLDNALAQKDVVFVQVNGRFRTTHEWSSPEQRERHFKR
jgi:FkbM family methyltransferase